MARGQNANDVEINMPVERSAGVIIFRNTPHGRKYLVLRSSRSQSQIAEKKFIKEFWDFPKGRLEPGEKGLDGALRELQEEAGIEKVEIDPTFKATVRYFTRRDGKPIPKFVAMFLGSVSSDRITLSWEHDVYLWLHYKEAHACLTLVPMKQALVRAEEFLKDTI